MQFQVQLVHADTIRCIVLISALDGDRSLGSCLGEASDAETAEDRALARLLARLAPAKIESASSQPFNLSHATTSSKSFPVLQTPVQAEPTDSKVKAKKETQLDKQTAKLKSPVDPEDWGSELAQLDLELQRLKWDRQAEAIYLKRAFEYPSRSRLTNFSDLMAYLRGLKQLNPGDDPSTAPVPLRRSDLLKQCDQLLKDLGWGTEKARQYLNDHLEASSRQQLNDEQLLRFNMLLETELIEHDGSFS